MILSNILAFLLIFMNIAKAKGQYDTNEINPEIEEQTLQAVNQIIDNVKLLHFDMYTSHSRLHLQSDLINSLRAQVLHDDSSPEQCDITEMFNAIVMKLSKIQQNLFRLLNQNDDQLLDKVDSILFNVKTPQNCVANHSQAFEQIKMELLNKTLHIKEMIEHLEHFESVLVKTATTTITAEGDITIKALEDITQQIHMKLAVQENKLLGFHQHLSELQNETLTNDNNKSRCLKKNCLIYHKIAEKK